MAYIILNNLMLCNAAEKYNHADLSECKLWQANLNKYKKCDKKSLLTFFPMPPCETILWRAYCILNSHVVLLKPTQEKTMCYSKNMDMLNKASQRYSIDTNHMTSSPTVWLIWVEPFLKSDSLCMLLCSVQILGAVHCEMCSISLHTIPLPQMSRLWED